MNTNKRNTSKEKKKNQKGYPYRKKHLLSKQDALKQVREQFEAGDEIK